MPGLFWKCGKGSTRNIPEVSTHLQLKWLLCVFSCPGGLQTSDKTILYSVANTLVNCTNSYDVKEVVPELVQLAKFSKQHVPEEHPKVGPGQLGGGC